MLSSDLFFHSGWKITRSASGLTCNGPFRGYEPKTLCGDNETICYESVKQSHTLLPVNARLKA